jgi:[ribosomal protein S5]-alanine N-acetyltransferase
MLKGKVITLRPVHEDDLPQLYEHILNIENRGDFYPATIQTLAELRKELNTTGFWTPTFGLLLLIDNESGKVIGQIVYFKTVQYMVELEIGYILYDTGRRKQGAMSEALQLLTRYLFDTMQVNRIRLCIETMNKASRGVAKNGGYTHEGTMRGCFFNKGRYRDMELYAITRDDLAGEKSG